MCYPKSIWDCLCCCFPSIYKLEDEDDGEVEDRSAANLSHVGLAVYKTLRTYPRHHHKQWNVTSGVVVGDLQQTPLSIPEGDPPDNHDDWFVDKMCEVMCKTRVWCDVMSLSPPDGLFLEKIQESLKIIAENNKENEKPVILRFMFGNIVGMPVNCTKVINALTKDLPPDSNLKLWVGAWRKGVSWNHAKLIAVDGRYLHTGGHNMWDYHYLKNNPVHDLSMELEGRITHDGHRFANEQWKFIQRIQLTACGWLVDKMPDGLPLVAKTRVTVSEYPSFPKAAIFPPQYQPLLVDRYAIDNAVPIISMGRQGTIHWRTRPSDEAILAMLGSAKTIIHMVLQDLGPVCIPGTKITLPGCVWPKEYLSVLGKVIWEKGVDVEIVLSNPGSIPGGLKATEACYGNGWSCVDVAAEIIKTIQVQFPEAEDSQLRKVVADNLRVCFLKGPKGAKWDDGKTMALHSKHFIVDDVCSYTGSQNLYICDLAEWGVVVDDPATTKKMMDEYWSRIWKYSYTGTDCDVQAVMDGLEIDRDAEEQKFFMNPFEKRKMEMEMAKMQTPTRRMGSLVEKTKTEEDGAVKLSTI